MVGTLCSKVVQKRFVLTAYAGVKCPHSSSLNALLLVVFSNLEIRWALELDDGTFWDGLVTLTRCIVRVHTGQKWMTTLTLSTL